MELGPTVFEVCTLKSPEKAAKFRGLVALRFFHASCRVLLTAVAERRSISGEVYYLVFATHTKILLKVQNLRLTKLNYVSIAESVGGGRKLCADLLFE